MRTHLHMWVFAYTHEQRRAHTYTTHHALHVVSSILEQSAVLPHVSRSHLLDIRRKPSSSVEIRNRSRGPCVQASARPDVQGRQTASTVAMLSDTFPDCARPRAQSPQPLLDGRNSIASTTRATFERRTRLRSRIARGTVAPAIFRPGDLLHTRCRRLHRFHHRWCNHSFRRRRLKIGRVDHWHARHLACVHASVTMIGCDPSRPDTQGRGSCRQTRRTAGVTVAPARAIAPSRTTPACVPRPLLGRCPGSCHFRGPGSGSGRPRKAARRLGLCHTCQEARAKSNVQVHRRRSAASC
jgi:hypothetical protein